MHYRNLPRAQCRSPLKLSHHAEVGTATQPPQSIAAAPAKLWQPSSPNALLAMGLMIWEVAENHASASLTLVTPEHKHDLSIIVAAPTAALPVAARSLPRWYPQ